MIQMSYWKLRQLFVGLFLLVFFLELVNSVILTKKKNDDIRLRFDGFPLTRHVLKCIYVFCVTRNMIFAFICNIFVEI